MLRATGSGLAVVGPVSVAAAGPDDHVEVNVGYARESGRRAARAAADEVVRAFDSIDAVTVRLPMQAADALSRRADVRYVEENAEMYTLLQTLPWSIDRVDADVARASGETGAGAHVAIVDTGIDSDHPDLQANLGEGKAIVPGEPLPRDCSDSDNVCHVPWDDDSGHGTSVAGTVAAEDDARDLVGVSTESTLHAVKVFGCSGAGSFSTVVAGIEWVADRGYDVANLSFGGGKSSTVEDAVEYAASAGVTLVAAAGNSGPCSDCVAYPAAEPEVVAVGATNPDDDLAGFSSTGPEVELVAPGVNVTVLRASDDEALFTGTSIAAGHVSGGAGLLAANGLSRSQIRQTLKDNAENIGLSSNESGAGLLDVAAALGLDSSDDL